MMELVSKGGVTGNKNVADNFSVVEKESVESNYFWLLSLFSDAM